MFSTNTIHVLVCSRRVFTLLVQNCVCRIVLNIRTLFPLYTDKVSVQFTSLLRSCLTFCCPALLFGFAIIEMREYCSTTVIV